MASPAVSALCHVSVDFFSLYTAALYTTAVFFIIFTHFFSCSSGARTAYTEEYQETAYGIYIFIYLCVLESEISTCLRIVMATLYEDHVILKLWYTEEQTGTVSVGFVTCYTLMLTDR